LHVRSLCDERLSLEDGVGKRLGEHAVSSLR
jgi:hypothetical protein